MTKPVVKVCETCGRFRRYHAADQYCIICGYDTLAAACTCGRDLEYALDEGEEGGLHCPNCGRDWRSAALGG